LRESQISYILDNYCFPELLEIRLGAWCAICASNLLPLLIHQDTYRNVHHSECHA